MKTTHMITRLLAAMVILGLAPQWAGGADDSDARLGGTPVVLAHGGARSPESLSGETALAARAAWEALEAGGSSVDAAVAGAMIMENNPRFNAGTGANIRMDGETVQMDAAVMNERGDFGAVALIEDVRNPVFVAREVMKSPHLMLAGEGAIRFARSLGLPSYDPRSRESVMRYDHLRYRMRNNFLEEDWDGFDWKKHWNFPKKLDLVLVPNDTIGVVVSDGKGGFGVAISTGGTSTTMNGRVGDVPIMGAGSFAGPAGAVCATGWGEYIIRKHLAERVYDWMAEGLGVDEAVRRGLALFPKHIGIGLIAVGPDGHVARANTSMAWAGIVGGRLIKPFARAAHDSAD